MEWSLVVAIVALPVASAAEERSDDAMDTEAEEDAECGEGPFERCAFISYPCRARGGLTQYMLVVPAHADTRTTT